MTALFEGKRVIGPARDIQEARNAISAYEALPRWNPSSHQHLLDAHGLLMAGLMERPGRFRTGGVGIYRGEDLVHMAPPASPAGQLCRPLRAGVHPPLRRWQRQARSSLPIEEVIRARQQGYDDSLGQADQQGELEPFVSYLLAAIGDALEEALRPQPTSLAGSEMSSEIGSEMPSPREVEVLELLSAQPRLSARELLPVSIEAVHLMSGAPRNPDFRQSCA